jgi:hypothetical protein
MPEYTSIITCKKLMIERAKCLSWFFHLISIGVLPSDKFMNQQWAFINPCHRILSCLFSQLTYGGVGVGGSHEDLMDCFALQFRFLFVVQLLNQTCPFYVIVLQKCAEWTNCERPSLSASSISELLNTFQLNLVLAYKNFGHIYFSPTSVQYDLLNYLFGRQYTQQITE